MQQNILQSDRPLLRIGSIAFIAGVVIVIVSTLLHPSREDPANHPLVFMEYANSGSWVAVHLGQFAGGIMVFGGDLEFSTRCLCAQNRAQHPLYLGLALQLQ